MSTAIGWMSSILLLLTILSQIARQWKEGRSEGVSPWLFVGQMLASAGFVVYSISLHSSVFIATNSLMFLSAVVGLVILARHRRAGRR